MSEGSAPNGLEIAFNKKLMDLPFQARGGTEELIAIILTTIG